MRLDGKVAVITGAASGMGLAIATRFAAEGAAVVAGDWNTGRLDAAVAAIRVAGGNIVGAQGNIADRATAEALIELAISTHGRVDMLCNNAGVMDSMQGVGELDDRLDPFGASRTGAYAALIPATLEPRDIANLALFLASDESRYINGAVITADAGWTAA